LLIILISVINNSSHPYPVQELFRTYTVHRVTFNPRGYDIIKKICIHWYDYTQQEKWTDLDIATEFQLKTSPRI
ncbi:748_t:CDS:1, partial [Funneliformis geosporum]